MDEQPLESPLGNDGTASGLRSAARSGANSLWAHSKPLVKSRTQMLWTHLRRCFGWRLNRTEPTLHESDLFDKAGIENTTLRAYLSWRRSQMLCSVPVLMSAAITGLSQVIRHNNLTDEGNAIYNLPNIANFVLLVAVMGAIGFPRGELRVWPKWRLSSKIIRLGFIVSFILPIIPAIIPLRYLSNDSSSDNANDSFPSAISNLRSHDSTIRVGINNFISALPVLVSFPSALLAGSLRIRGLLPDSSLSSWILTAAAPFLSIVILSVAILIVQFGGDLVLMIGVLIRCFYPWLYVLRRGLYVKATNDEREKKVDCNQKVILVMNLASLALIINWMFNQDILKSEEAMSYAKFILEFWGRVLATTVVFTDMLLRMTVTNWQVEKSMRNMDDLYESIERGISKNRSSGTPEEAMESAEDLGPNAALKAGSISGRDTAEGPQQGETKVSYPIIQDDAALDGEESSVYPVLQLSRLDNLETCFPEPSILIHPDDIESGVTEISTYSTPNGDFNPAHCIEESNEINCISRHALSNESIDASKEELNPNIIILANASSNQGSESEVVPEHEVGNSVIQVAKLDNTEFEASGIFYDCSGGVEQRTTYSNICESPNESQDSLASSSMPQEALDISSSNQEGQDRGSFSLATKTEEREANLERILTTPTDKPNSPNKVTSNSMETFNKPTKTDDYNDIVAVSAKTDSHRQGKAKTEEELARHGECWHEMNEVDLDERLMQLMHGVSERIL